MIENYFGFGGSTVNYTSKIEDDKLILNVELPGVEEKDVEITSENNHLSLKARRGKYEYNNTFNVNRTYDITAAKASLRLGILTLTIPRHELMKPKRIELT